VPAVQPVQAISWVLIDEEEEEDELEGFSFITKSFS
jgi:hypothetical protein